MARLHHLSLVVSVSLLLLLLPILAAAAAAAAEAEPDIRISVQYPTEEESRWLDRWSEKYRAQGSGSGFSVQPATDEESAILNRMFSDAKKRGGSDHSSQSHSCDGEEGGGGGRAGFDGHIEFDGDHPFGRIVVDTIHSRDRSSKPNDAVQTNEEESHVEAEYDVVKDL